MQQQLVKVIIPTDIDFTDLRLARDTDGSVSFDLSVVERIYQESGLPVELLRAGPEDNVAGLITHWYMLHRQAGGAPDPVAEELISEVIVEESRGQSISHAPGRA